MDEGTCGTWQDAAYITDEGITFPQKNGDFPLLNKDGKRVGTARVREQQYVGMEPFFQAWFEYEVKLIK